MNKVDIQEFAQLAPKELGAIVCANGLNLRFEISKDRVVYYEELWKEPFSNVEFIHLAISWLLENDLIVQIEKDQITAFNNSKNIHKCVKVKETLASALLQLWHDILLK